MNETQDVRAKLGPTAHALWQNMVMDADAAGFVQASREELAKALGTTVRVLRRALCKLSDTHLIEPAARPGGTLGRWKVDTYPSVEAQACLARAPKAGRGGLRVPSARYGGPSAPTVGPQKLGNRRASAPYGTQSDGLEDDPAKYRKQKGPTVELTPQNQTEHSKNKNRQTGPTPRVRARVVDLKTKRSRDLIFSPSGRKDAARGAASRFYFFRPETGSLAERLLSYEFPHFIPPFENPSPTVDLSKLADEGHIPGFPHSGKVPHVFVPPPPLLDPDLSAGERADRLWQAFTAVCESRGMFSRRAGWTSGKQGGLARGKREEGILRSAAAVMLEHEVPPMAWVAWSFDVWGAAASGGRGRRSSPPVAWVFSAKRVREKRGWFFDDAKEYLVKTQLSIPECYDLHRRYGLMRPELRWADGDLSKTRAIVEKFFPPEHGGYDGFVERAKAASEWAKAAVREKILRGEFVWGNFSAGRPKG